MYNVQLLIMQSMCSNNMNMLCLYTDLWCSMDAENKENAEKLGRGAAALTVQCELGMAFTSCLLQSVLLGLLFSMKA
jgi:hypothetical protein